MTVHYYKHKGKYNWASNEEQFQVVLRTEFGNLSEIWPSDEEPEVDDLLPSEVLDLIEKRNDSYWISTSREETRAKIAKIREHSKELDRAWLQGQLTRAEKHVSEIKSRIEDLVEEPESVTA